jgi:hypothetical protein
LVETFGRKGADNQVSALPKRVYIRLTRPGFQAIAIGSLCAIGAVIRDLNLLVILAGLALGALWMQWRIGRGNLRSVSAFQQLPTEAFAGDPFTISVLIQNQNRRLGVFQVTASTPIIHQSSRPGVNHGQRASRPAIGTGWVAAIGPQDQESIQIRCQTSERGKCLIGPLRLESEYPFGLLLNRRQMQASQDSLVVFPQRLTLRGGWRQQFRRYLVGGNRAGQRAGIHEGHFFGLRTWQPGDSRRWIHWRTTARIGEVAVRQFEQPRAEQMLLVVDLHDSGDADGKRAVERAVALAGTITEQLTRSSFFRLVLGVAGTTGMGAAGTATSQIRRMALTILAEASGSSTPEIEPMLVAIGAVAGKHWPLMVVSTRKYSGQVWPLAGQRWLDAQGPTWICVSDSTTDSWVEWPARLSEANTRS